MHQESTIPATWRTATTRQFSGRWRHAPVIALFLALLAAPTLSAQESDPEYPVFDPSLADYDNIAALLLAEELKEQYNGNTWGDSVSLRFDFVSYTAEGSEISRTTNEWNLVTDRARLTGTLDDGSRYVVEFSSLRNLEGTMLVDSVAIPEAHQAQGLATAYDKLVSHTYWLTMPMRLLDPDLSLEVLPDTTLNTKPFVPMVVTFNDSNLSATSARLYIDRDHKTIERWRINYEGIEREFIHRMTRRIGPFIFATRLWSDDFGSYIQLERIKVRKVE